MMLLRLLLLIQVIRWRCGAIPLETASREGFPWREVVEEGRQDRARSLTALCDPRFAKRQLSDDEHNTARKNLMRTYLAAFNDLGIETWLMHSALLGWWWTKQLFPWDMDISMQVSEPVIFFLAAHYNMSTFSFRGPGIPRDRRYLLELSPYAKDREQADPLQPADARWIDTKTGIFVNVFAVRYNATHPGGEGMLSCKDGSEMMDTYLFPLRKTVFEGVPAKIPFRYRELLVVEYGAEALEMAGHQALDEEKVKWTFTKAGGDKKAVGKAVKNEDL